MKHSEYVIQRRKGQQEFPFTTQIKYNLFHAVKVTV